MNLRTMALFSSLALAGYPPRLSHPVGRHHSGYRRRSQRYQTWGSRCRSIKDHPSFKDRRP